MISPQELERLWQDHAASLELIARGRCGSAEDCVQEAFIQLAKQSPVPIEPRAWLLRVVRNKAINMARAARRQRIHEGEVGRSKSIWVVPNTETTGDLYDAEQLTADLARMNDDLRDVLVAHLWGGMTFRQIGDAFELSHAAAHRRYQQAIAWLRTEIYAKQQTKPDIKVGVKKS